MYVGATTAVPIHLLEKNLSRQIPKQIPSDPTSARPLKFALEALPGDVDEGIYTPSRRPVISEVEANARVAAAIEKLASYGASVGSDASAHRPLLQEMIDKRAVDAFDNENIMMRVAVSTSAWLHDMLADGTGDQEGVTQLLALNKERFEAVRDYMLSTYEIEGRLPYYDDGGKLIASAYSVSYKGKLLGGSEG